jgi:hypothetical protein
MNLLRCEKCLGRKTIQGLGGMIEKCTGCKGIGYISDAVKEVVKTVRKKRTLKDEHIEQARTEKA